VAIDPDDCAGCKLSVYVIEDAQVARIFPVVQNILRGDHDAVYARSEVDSPNAINRLVHEYIEDSSAWLHR
jgi:hypothetical protein